MACICLAIRVVAQNEDALTTALSELAPIGIHEKSPHEWNAFFKAPGKKAKSGLSGAGYVFKEIPVEEKDWDGEWKKAWEPFYLTKNVVVCPTWKQSNLTASHTLKIDPKMTWRLKPPGWIF